jgi:probable phosphoglycerate mutase
VTVVLIRHAETEWSKAKRHTGRTDLPLLEEGRDHARTLPQRLRAWTFSTVFCSPLLRARQTAELAGLRDLRLHDGLLEWDYGDYEGITTDEIQADRPDWFLWEDGAPGGESPAEVQARVDGAIADIAAADAGDGDVAVVAHGHILRALGVRWCELPIEAGGRLQLGTAAVCVLGEERGRRVISRWNLT